jgi:hypothetical protein
MEVNFWLEFKIHLTALMVSFLDAITRFCDNRFNQDNSELSFLRSELSSLRMDYANLAKSLNTKPEQSGPEPAKDYEPIQGRVHWKVRAAQLQKEAREKLNQEKRKVEISRGEQESIDALEHELDIAKSEA